MNKLAVVALGGNALLRGDQAGTIIEQEQNTADTLENLVYLLKEGKHKLKGTFSKNETLQVSVIGGLEVSLKEVFP